MSLIQRTSENRASERPRAVGSILIALLAALLFLLNIRFGLPPAASGLDNSWKEVLGWSYLHHAQWGRDLIFTYGPTGFLYPLANYIDGVFWPFMLGQIALTATFALLTATITLRCGALATIALAMAFAAWFGLIPGEVSLPLILLFGTSVLADRAKRPISTWSVLILLALAMTFGVVACSKFSLFPLWVLCAMCIAIAVAKNHSLGAGAFVLGLFATALLLVWIACNQQLGNLTLFLSNSLDVASGYGHAMGSPAVLRAEVAGFACLMVFAVLCLLMAWRSRREFTHSLIPLLYSAAALWAWRAHFTRGDHALYFFALMSLLPFGVLYGCELNWRKIAWSGLIALSLTCSGASVFVPYFAPPSARAAQMIGVMQDNFHNLTHLHDLYRQRQTEWAAAQRTALLPEIIRRVGDASIDMVSVEQGVVLLNGFNYTPRPVFQSYSAYTPHLAKLNEAYFLGLLAPKFVLLKIEAIDGRFPMSEDALALVALLRRYQPVTMEKGFLLLQRDESAIAAPVELPRDWQPAAMDQDIRVGNSASIAFVKIDLTLLGRLYSLFLREPTLRILVRTDAGINAYRFIRPTGGSGFTISPLMRSEQDFLMLQLGMPLPPVRDFRIVAETSWQNALFDHSIEVGFQALRELQTPAATASPELIRGIFPGFSNAPTAIHGINNPIVENGENALSLHAPAIMEFQPAPGRYAISAKFGIRDAALTDRGCAAANPDGVGVSLSMRHSDNTEIQLLHRELDPFHMSSDRGVRELREDNVAVSAGDSVVYRVDPGHGGGNTACDWSYVRDFSFAPAQ
jgi:hypothetical protein